jgi:hypothetical protein
MRNSFTSATDSSGLAQELQVAVEALDPAQLHAPVDSAENRGTLVAAEVTARARLDLRKNALQRPSSFGIQPIGRCHRRGSDPGQPLQLRGILQRTSTCDEPR